MLYGLIDLLIGQDCLSHVSQLEAKSGMKDEPYAVKTALGWSICGPIGNFNNSQSVQWVYSPLDEITHLDCIVCSR